VQVTGEVAATLEVNVTEIVSRQPAGRIPYIYGFQPFVRGLRHVRAREVADCIVLGIPRATAIVKEKICGIGVGVLGLLP
jgi:hypothetical protein